MCSKTALTTITQLWDGKNRLILHAGSWEFFSTLTKKRALNSEKRGASLRPLTSCFFTWLSCYGKVDHHSRIGKSESLDFPNSRKPTTSTQTSKTQGTRQRSCYVGLFDDVRTKESPLLLSHKGNLLLIQPKMLKVGGKTFLRSKVSFDLFSLVWDTMVRWGAARISVKLGNEFHLQPYAKTVTKRWDFSRINVWSQNNELEGNWRRGKEKTD